MLLILHRLGSDALQLPRVVISLKPLSTFSGEAQAAVKVFHRPADLQFSQPARERWQAAHSGAVSDDQLGKIRIEAEVFRYRFIGLEDHVCFLC